LWFGTSGCTTLSSVSDLDLSPSEMESFHCMQIEDSCFLVKKFLDNCV
jgi:hypothetical protein